MRPGMLLLVVVSVSGLAAPPRDLEPADLLNERSYRDPRSRRTDACLD